MHKLLTVIFLILPFAAYAAPITLRDAVQTGLNNSQRYLSVKDQTEAARATVQLAGSKKLPQLIFTENINWTNEPGGSLFTSLNQQRLELSPSANTYNDPPARSDFQSRLLLTQTLYDPDISYGQQVAAEQAAAAEAMQGAAAETLALNVVSAYLDIQRTEVMLAWVEASLLEAQELKRLAVERHQAGTGLKSDVLNTEVQVAASLRQQLWVHNQRQTAQRNLALQIGHADSELQMTVPLTLENIPEPQQRDNFLRPDLIALDRQHKAAEISRIQAAAAWQPKLTGAASWTLHDRDFPLADSSDSWMVNAGLSWVLFDGFGRKHASTRARAEERSQLARHRQAVRQARFDQESARQQTETLRQQLQVSQASLIATEESYQLLLDRYQNGLAPLSELLTVQSLLQKGRSEVANSEAQLLFSRAQQHYLQGTLLPTILHMEGSY